MEDNVKRWWWSNTIQLAALQFVTGFVAAFFTEFPPEAGWVIMAKSIIDLLLRAKTNKGVE